MGFRINTNTPAIAAQRALGKSSKGVEDNIKHLATGSRIVQASDDAAGLAISERIKSIIKSSQQANRNANDSISLVQVAEGGINEIQNIMTRLRELSIQSASDTVSHTERSFTDMEYQQLKNEIQRIAEVTRFNGADLLSGKGGRFDFQVDVGNGEEDRISFNSSESDMTLSGLNISHLGVSEKSKAQNSLETIDGAIERISQQRSSLGAIQSRLTSSSNNLSVFEKSQSDANSRIRDADFAIETSDNAKNSIVQQAGTSVLSQATNVSQNALRLLT